MTSKLPPTSIKQKVSSNLGAGYATRFGNLFWSYRVCQLTTSNVRSMKESTIAMSYDSNAQFQNRSSSSSSGSGGGENNNNNNNNSNSNHDDNSNNSAAAPVRSDLQPHAMHTFRGEEFPSVVLAVPKSSEHLKNLLSCQRGSLMVGHTDPQLFHWFKQLGTLPARGIVSGQLDVLTGDLAAEVWETTFTKHPVIHNIAQSMWEADQSKTEAERAHIDRRLQEEDDKRMRRMSSSDWRKKFKERERNPTTVEDEEKPVYVVKADTFAVVRLKPEVRLWTNCAGHVSRVYEPNFPKTPDPLARASPRFLRMLNVARAKLVPSLNMNFNLRLTNAFICDMDSTGLWAMGTQGNTLEGQQSRQEVREEWAELRLEFGKGQVISTEQEMEWWIRGLTKLGAPEMSQTNNTVEDANMNPEDFDYRHI